MFTIVLIVQALTTYNMAIVNTGCEAPGYYLILLACGYLRSIQCRLISLEERQNNTKQNVLNFINMLWSK
jgi:hypothetical protein